MERNVELIKAARKAYERCAGLRARRERYKRFTYGDQWSDPAIGASPGMTEGDEMLSRGYKPLTNNMIRQLVKCIIGRWRYRRAERPVQLSAGAAKVYEANELDEIDCRTLEEFLISGCAIQRVVRENRPSSGTGTYVDMVSPARFFVNATGDPRGRDIELAGMLHDMSVTEVFGRFGTDPARARELARMYAGVNGREAATGENMWGDDTFGTAADGRCRVIEVWTLECSGRLLCHDPDSGRISTVRPDRYAALAETNRLRAGRGATPLKVKVQHRAVWRGRYMTADGTVLGEAPAVLNGNRHPFAIKMYPLTDGEVHPLVEDVIDQQVYVNRLITLLDRVMLTSAKGALLFPQNQLGDGMDMARVAEAWAAPDGVIPYRPVPGQPEPHQLVTNATDIGARELLEVQMRLFERISGVSDALQGRAGSGNTGVDMYDSQVRNALISVADLLDSYDSFVRNRNTLL